jgi:4-azaleucine resistance transporter AzlC
MVGGIPVGITCGILSTAAGLNLSEVVLMSGLVFSGAAQLVAVSMIAAGVVSPGLVMVNVLLVSLHNLLLTASLAPYMIMLPKFWRGLLCFGISDGTYAITMNRAGENGYSQHYQLGASVVQYLFWISANIAGAFVGSYIVNPSAWGLDFTLIAVFIAILIPKLKDRVMLGVSASAAVAALAGATYLGGKWHILLACVAATLTGVILERRRSY